MKLQVHLTRSVIQTYQAEIDVPDHFSPVERETLAIKLAKQQFTILGQEKPWTTVNLIEIRGAVVG